MLVVSGGCAGMLLYFGAVHLSPAVGELTASIQLRTRPSSPDFGPLVHCLATIRP